MEPRGIRNNNPGNIRLGAPWVGLAPEQPDPDFCTFEDPKYGIRALAKILKAYEQNGRRTIRTIIDRYAPPSENLTNEYAAHVASLCGVDPDAPIEVTALLPQLIPAIITHENGKQPYPEDTILAGIALA
jgi:hypothetical protein